MSLVRIAWRNVLNRRLQTWITVLVIALGLSMTMSVTMLAAGLRNGLAEASKPYGMLVGSKGSANQLVFNTIYLMDTPLANLPLSYVRQLAEDERVRRVVPFAMGDNYRGHRIVGTDGQFFALRPSTSDPPSFQVAEGRVFDKPFEAVIGHRVAQATGLKVGDTFTSGHGTVESLEADDAHADHPYVVVGVLEKSGLPADQGIFVPLESYWISHDQHGLGEEERGVTSLLVEPDSYMHLMQLYAEINREPVAQAVFPGQVLAGVFDMLGSGEDVWAYVGYMVTGMTLLAILLFLYNATLEKRRPIAILRAIGAGRRHIFAMVMLEAAWVMAWGTLLGVVLAFAISQAGAWLIAKRSTLGLVLSFSLESLSAIGLVWALGLAAAILPAAMAYRTEVARHLSPG